MTSRTLLASIFIAIGFSACSENKQTADDGFWSWFKPREAQLAELFSYDTQVASHKNPELREKIEATVKEAGNELRKVHPEFSPVFGYSDGSNQLVITVHGQPDYFEAVDTFIASAPAIEGWTFVALKQPLELGADTEIRSGTVTLKVGDFRYAKTKNVEGSFDFVIHVPAKVADDPEGFERLFTRLTTDFLGERFTSTAVGNIKVVELTDAAPANLFPFVDIYADVAGAMQGK